MRDAAGADMRQVLRGSGQVARAVQSQRGRAATRRGDLTVQPQPATRYAERDGAQIAYQVFGAGSADLIYCGGLASNCDHVWDVPEHAAVLWRLARHFRVILFDRRGAGHSDPLPGGRFPTWEDWSDDMLSVLDAVGSPRSIICGERDGGFMALLFASMHPERTQVLSLGNTAARYLSDDDYPCGMAPEQANQQVRLFREKWGTDELTAMLLPHLRNNPQSVAMRSRGSRGAATPRLAAEYFRYMFELDVRSILHSIRVPTLIFHRTGFPLVRVEAARYLADHIPGARLIEIPGSDGAILLAEDAAPTFLQTLVQFVTGAPADSEAERSLATVLFCDIVDSTKLAAELGDKRWNELLERFYGLVRAELTSFGGREIDTAGDGFFMAFSRPTRAIHCARTIIDAVKALGLHVRCGVHTGECTVSGDKLTGVAVHVGARVAGAATPDEVWVSETVKALTLGSAVSFADRGSHDLKGTAGQWQLYAASTATVV